MIKKLLSFATAALGFMSSVNAEEVWDNGVLVLNDDSFDEAIAKYEYLLVEFYAPWCGHCKKLAPEYEAAAEVLKGQDPPLTIAKVDATENDALKKRFEIKGFPTLHFFTNGERQDYTGGRTKDTIVQWINKKTGPASQEVDCATMESKVSDAFLALSYFGEQDGDLWVNYMRTANHPQLSEKFQFFHTSDSDCASKFGTSAPGIGLSRKFDESPLGYKGAPKVDEIVEFAKKSSVPILIDFAEEFAPPIFHEKKPSLVLFTKEKDGQQAFQEVYAKAAEAMNGQILFTKAGMTTESHTKLAKSLKVSEDQMPSLRLIDSGKKNRYIYTGDLQNLTQDDIQSFVNDFKSGALIPHLESEEIPETATVDGLTTVVGKSWQDIVMDDSKDVFVEIYAPWCGHCKKLEPIWKEVARITEGVEDLIIAKMDGTANEAEGLNIKGFPTLLMYPKGNKKNVKDYGKNSRDTEGAFLKWLSENSAVYKAAGEAKKAEREAAKQAESIEAAANEAASQEEL